LGINGRGDQVGTGVSAGSVWFNFDLDFDGWSGDLPVFPASAEGLNGGDVEIVFERIEHSEYIEFE
jgi:hypothetical protein